MSVTENLREVIPSPPPLRLIPASREKKHQGEDHSRSGRGNRRRWENCFGKAIPSLAALIVFLFLFAGCTERETIRPAGSTTVLPIVARCAEIFEIQHPEVRLILNAGGSGVGINQVGKGSIDLGMTSRSLTDAEGSQFSQLREHVIARDAVIPVVSSVSI